MKCEFPFNNIFNSLYRQKLHFQLKKRPKNFFLRQINQNKELPTLRDALETVDSVFANLFHPVFFTFFVAFATSGTIFFWFFLFFEMKVGNPRVSDIFTAPVKERTGWVLHFQAEYTHLSRSNSIKKPRN